MYAATSLVALLSNILPTFDRDAEAKSAPGSDGWMFYVQLRAELMILNLTLDHVQNILFKSEWNLAQCMPALQNILDLFESSCTGKMTDVGNRLSIYEYPQLEKIRTEGKLSKGMRIFFDYSDSKGILEGIAAWTKQLQQCFTAPTSSVALEQDRASRPPRLVKNTAILLKNAVDTFRQCQCAASHDCMLLLGTKHKVEETHPFVTFDLLYRTFNESSSLWRESKVYVIVHDNRDQKTKVTFKVGDDRVLRAPPRREKVEDLCACVKEASPNMCLNMRLENTLLYRTGARRSRLTSLNLGPHESLKNIIAGLPIINPQTKIILAVLVSYSVLYFSGTSWLPPGWSKTSFYMLKSVEESSFVLRPLLATGENVPTVTKGAPIDVIHKHPDLLQLGILLLEIFLKEPIESLRDDDDHDPSNIEQNTNFFTAERQFDEYEWDVNENYKAAVAACLRCNVHDNNSSKDRDTQYCEYIYENVIRPLETELAALCGIRSDELDQMMDEFLTGKESQATAQQDHHPGESSWGKLAKKVTSWNTSSKRKTMDDAQDSRSAKERRLEPGSPQLLGVFQPPRCLDLAMFDDHALSPSTNTQLSLRADSWLRLFNETIYSSRYDQLYKQRKMNTIKIAILDSGVDGTDQIIQQNRSRITYRDFVTDSHDTPNDFVGHGTHTASVTLGIARNAHLYIARVVEGSKLKDPSTLAKALIHAADTWTVDIICLPFSFPRLARELQPIQDAITHAYSKHILILAAAANHGGLQDVAYPANQAEVIAINATDGEGNISHFNPSPHDSSVLSVLGEAVPCAWGARMDPFRVFARKSGTSFAVPVAAGIAAVLLDYIEHRRVFWTEDQRYLASKIRSPKGMVGVMQAHMGVARGGFWFLRPWKLFEKEFQAIDELVLDTLRDV